VVREIAQLLLGDTVFSADGRTDVDSEVTSDQQCRLDGRERLQLRGNTLRSFAQHVVRARRGEHTRMVAEHL